MAHGMPRTRFNSSGLVRALSDLAVAEVPGSKQSFADRLGQWLDFTDALALFSALNAGTAAGVEPRAAAPSTAGELARQEFERVRAALADSITTDGMLAPGRAGIALPLPAQRASVDSAADFAPYHRCYLAHQRNMNLSIGPLRASVRAALSRHSPALGRLASLDAVMDQALAARERNLLATVPSLLARRFEQLFKAHQAALAEAQVADEPGQWMQAGGWLAAFCSEVQAVLLAELDLRLQPVAGLIAALDHEPGAGSGLRAGGRPGSLTTK
jgi:hypothetical protein